MAESHSESKGGWLYVTSVELWSGPDGRHAFIKLDIPVNFDFKKSGNGLLRNIQSAVNLFFKPGETNEDAGHDDNDFGRDIGVVNPRTKRGDG
jgi:hypothetical protein